MIRRNGTFYIKDLGSTNGIDYKGMRIDNKRIDEGDVFHLCDYELRFTYRADGLIFASRFALRAPPATSRRPPPEVVASTRGAKAQGFPPSGPVRLGAPPGVLCFAAPSRARAAAAILLLSPPVAPASLCAARRDAGGTSRSSSHSPSRTRPRLAPRVTRALAHERIARP